MKDLLLAPRRFFANLELSPGWYLVAAAGFYVTQISAEINPGYSRWSPPYFTNLVDAIPRAALAALVVSVIWIFVPTKILKGDLTFARSFVISGVSAFLPYLLVSTIVLVFFPRTATSNFAYDVISALGLIAFAWALSLLLLGVKHSSGLSWPRSCLVVFWPIVFMLGFAGWLWVKHLFFSG
jgi:hypothetical protein